ncbi:MAG: hypothetical protein K5Q00_06395 [Gammaproteobacteria bacterium]|nr:hypothetical protein [Gammaproteobacteria bacterium]
MKMKKTFLTTMVVSGLMLGSTAMAVTGIHTDNQSGYYIVSKVGVGCSTLFGLGAGTTGPHATALAAWNQVTALCPAHGNCNAGVFISATEPAEHQFTCPSVTTQLATATLIMDNGTISFGAPLAGWTISAAAGTDPIQVTITGPNPSSN